jgi:hypothetical protein
MGLPGTKDGAECWEPQESLARGVRGMGPGTKFLEDIYRQPMELQRALERFQGDGVGTLREVTRLRQGSERVNLTGIGASWNAALAYARDAGFERKCAEFSGVDCDTFRICSLIVEDEGGLLGKKEGAK